MPRIYVACLSSYVAGKLHGTWVDLDNCVDVDDINTAIKAMLKASTERPAEEYAIHDHDGFDGIAISEHASMDDVFLYAHLLETYPGEIIEVARTETNDSLESYLEDAYLGCYESRADYAEEMIGHEVDKLPENLQRFFDMEEWVRDQERRGELHVYRTETGLHFMQNV